MIDNLSFYSHPWEERYIPTEEAMEQERLQIIEWEKYQEEKFYQKWYKEEIKEQEKNKSV